MAKLRVSSFAVSIDGFGAGPDQDLENPIGQGGVALMEWFFNTRTWRHMHRQDGGETGVDDKIAADGLAGIGAWILGRNMFGPIRGPWPDDRWKGWWGDEPPYHTPVFVLTHHARPRRSDDSAISARRPHRRAASRAQTGLARKGRSTLRRHRSARAWVRSGEACAGRTRDSCVSSQARLVERRILRTWSFDR